jgi:hypothetical protein
MEWSPPTLILGRYIGAVLDEQLRDIEITVKGSQVKRSRPTLILGCYIGTMLNK